MNPEKIIASENKNQLPDIPKSKEIYSGDINDAVITVQKITGYEITPEWWEKYVGSDGSTEDILERFDTAFEKFVREQITGVSMDEQEEDPSGNEQQALQEANVEYDKFNEQFKDDPEYDKLSQEFLEALRLHLMNKYFSDARESKDDEESAWERYNAYGSPEYNSANQERWEAGDLLVRHYGKDDEITVIGTINQNDDGSQTLEHDYSVESSTIHELEQRLVDYFDNTPVEHQSVIVEGGFENVHFDTHDGAIEAAAEAGLTTYIAQQRNVQIIGGDPKPADTYEQMIHEGTERIDVAAMEAVRGIVPELRRGTITPGDVSMVLYQAAATMQVEGIRAYTDKEKQQLQDEGRTQEALADIKRQVKELLVPHFNNLVRDAMDDRQDLFIAQDDGSITLNINVDTNDTNALDRAMFPLWHPDGDSQISKVWRKNGEIRDKFLFERIIEARQDGKRPFVVFGGPHVVALEPVLRAYFEK